LKLLKIILSLRFPKIIICKILSLATETQINKWQILQEKTAFNGYSQTTNAAEYFNTNDSSERTYIDKTEELK
jgi:hypothetical protein